jgi:1,4-dihydroxy-2-naphthoyl-CoA hydrolase
MSQDRSKNTKQSALSRKRVADNVARTAQKPQVDRVSAGKSTPNRAHEVVLNGGMAQTLGVRLLTVTRKRVTAEMPVTEKHMNRSGRVNGGALMAFADLVGATGTVANLPVGHRTTTLESKTNFFAAGEAPLLTAIAKPLHIGRTTMVWQTTIRNADKRLVAVVTQTQVVLPRPRSTQNAITAHPQPHDERKRGGPRSSRIRQA